MRRRALRHGHAGVAGCFSAHMGKRGPTVLARSDSALARKVTGLLTHGGSLLGHGMDDAAIGIRLCLRQTALPPTARRTRPARARAFSRRPRVPEQARAIPGKPRRTARG